MLAQPFAYIVSYDLKGRPSAYMPLINELKSSHTWWHYLDSTWIILRRETLVELSPKLRKLIFQNDRLLIMPAKGPSDGWLPKDAWKWMQDNVPSTW